jgi:hypothetical protein
MTQSSLYEVQTLEKGYTQCTLSQNKITVESLNLIGFNFVILTETNQNVIVIEYNTFRFFHLSLQVIQLDSIRSL